jgi:DNA-binding NtrC family response regulator
MAGNVGNCNVISGLNRGKAGMLRLDHFPSPAFGSRPGRKTPQVPDHGSPMVLQPGQQLTQLEEAYIRLTLDHVRGNRKRAAEMLGISLRTLQNRIAILREEEKAATSDS